MSGAEFAEWMAYYKLEPFGEERADLRAGIIASVIANIFSRKKRYKARDFMPQFRRERKTAGGIRSVLMGFAAAVNQRVKHGNNQQSGR